MVVRRRRGGSLWWMRRWCRVGGSGRVSWGGKGVVMLVSVMWK